MKRIFALDNGLELWVTDLKEYIAVIRVNPMKASLVTRGTCSTKIMKELRGANLIGFDEYKMWKENLKLGER